MVQAVTAAGLPIAPANEVRRRMVETNRRFEQDTNQFQANIGLQGEFSDIDWEVTYGKGHRTRNDTDYGQFTGVRGMDEVHLQRILVSTDCMLTASVEVELDQAVFCSVQGKAACIGQVDLNGVTIVQHSGAG